jgi:hypothetical protein
MVLKSAISTALRAWRLVEAVPLLEQLLLLAFGKDKEHHDWADFVSTENINPDIWEPLIEADKAETVSVMSCSIIEVAHGQ